MTDRVRCLACDRVVADHYQAKDCDSCGGWQHRGCGDTGLSKYKYSKLQKGLVTHEFTCERCKFLSDSSHSLPIPIMESTSEDVNPTASHAGMLPSNRFLLK
ncbi:hypothetical protein E2C01_018385 [Portunus trituberculatus]|uniref:Uncharacterized protein n=1 Tax=Portunus trituberculatus TaxID=210409 RepID=A0A5B7DW03_PORTR|nr:hypothetical protein [Portunus trituberculatus]